MHATHLFVLSQAKTVERVESKTAVKDAVLSIVAYDFGYAKDKSVASCTLDGWFVKLSKALNKGFSLGSVLADQHQGPMLGK